ncbi:hypothetical protein N2152v2_000213 [Parachlorella kessleri]
MTAGAAAGVPGATGMRPPQGAGEAPHLQDDEMCPPQGTAAAGRGAAEAPRSSGGGGQTLKSEGGGEMMAGGSLMNGGGSLPHHETGKEMTGDGHPLQGIGWGQDDRRGGDYGPPRPHRQQQEAAEQDRGWQRPPPKFHEDGGERGGRGQRHEGGRGGGGGRGRGRGRGRRGDDEGEGRMQWGNEDVRRQEEEEAQPDKEVEPEFGLSGALAAEANKVNGVVLVHTEPPEARKPAQRWRLYVFKKGEPFGDPLHIHRQSSYLFGRERRIADVPTDHPSCSKQHAVMQYRLTEKEGPDGMMQSAVRPYIMDLGSTNGTYVNNERIESQRYYELLNQDMLRFGNSSREYILLRDDATGGK